LRSARGDSFLPAAFSSLRLGREQRNDIVVARFFGPGDQVPQRAIS